MFFELSKSSQKKFPQHFILPNKLVLNTDEGWKKIVLNDYVIILKGYSNNYDLETLASKLTTNERTSIKGNFCAFVCTDDSVKILHDRDRGFPIWIGERSITNLIEQSEPVWEDCTLTVDSMMNVDKKWTSPYAFKRKEISDQSIIDNIHNLLNESFENFLSHNTLPLKMYLSGGIDTLLAWTYLDNFTKNYEIVDYEYIKNTYFYITNKKIIQKHQLYNQIHLWDHPCVLVTGSCGDEYFMRGPHTAGQILKYHGYNLIENISESDYMWYFLNRESSKQGVLNGIDSVKEDQSLESVYEDVFARNKNDFQHWHLDNTLTFTPFKDTSITELVLQSSTEQLISQAKNASIQKELIRKIDNRKLKFLTKWKNYYDVDNMTSLWTNINNLKKLHPHKK